MAYGIPQLRRQAIFDQYVPQYGDTGQDPFFDPPTTMPPESYNPYDPNQSPGTPGRGVDTPMTAPPPPPPRQDPAQGTSLQGWFDAINSGYTPSSFDRDRFRGVLDQFPERRQGSAVTAALIGLGERNRQGGGDPIKAMDQVLYGQGDRDIEDWKAKTTPYYNAAQLEQQGNTQERQLVGNAVTGFMGEQRLRSNERIQEERNEIARIRADAEKLKSEGWTFKVLGDRVVGYDPKRPGVEIPMGSSGGMNERDKIILENQGRVAAATASGASAIQRAREAGGTVYVDPESGEGTVINPRVQPPTRTPIPGGPIAKPRTQAAPGTAKTNTLEDRRIQNDKLKEFWQLDPEAKQYIMKEGDSYNFKKRPVAHPDTWWPGDHVPQEKVDAYDRFRKKVDPNYVPPASGPNTGKHPGEEYTEAPDRKAIGGSNKVPSTAKPAPSGVAPTRPPGVPPGAQYSPSRKMWRYSTDGGKTFKTVRGS